MFVPATRLLGANFLEFAVPEITDVVSKRKNLKTAAKTVGRQTLRKKWVGVAGKKLQAESFQQNP